jgi:acetate kinase
MGVTLIVNPGSSSKKFALYKDNVRLLDAYVESSIDGYNICTLVKGVQQNCSPINRRRFHESLGDFLQQAIEENFISSLMDVNTVAVRVVAPGTFFQTHRELNHEYLKKLQVVEAVAPLHIPHLLKEIEIIKKLLPQARLLAVSDSAFHAVIPDFIKNYSIPEKDASKYDIYRFGYHGLSVASVVRRSHAVVGFDAKRMIVCHIGSGVSVTAVKDEKSLDTSMGYAPGSGLIMGSRAGDLDSGALLAIMKKQNLKPIDAETYIQTQGGLIGLTGESDLRIILERRAHGDLVAQKAIASFIYQIQKTIGGYIAVMGGLDLLVFTATAGERNPTLRDLITKNLSGFGIKVDVEKNESCISNNGVISAMGSGIKVAVIKADETDEIMRITNTI